MTSCVVTPTYSHLPPTPSVPRGEGATDDLRTFQAVALAVSDDAMTLAEGRRHANAGRNTRAIACYRDVAASRLDVGASVEAFRLLVDLERAQGDMAAAVAAAQASYGLAMTHGLVGAAREAMNSEGSVYLTQGRYEEAEVLFSDVCAAPEFTRATANALGNLGLSAAMQRQFDRASHYLHAAIEAHRRLGEVRSEAIANNNLGRLLVDQGQGTAAEPFFEEARRLALALGERELHALFSLNLAQVFLVRGALVAAEQLTGEAMGQFGLGEAGQYRVRAFQLLADIAIARGEGDVAAACLTRGLDAAQRMALPYETAQMEARMADLQAGSAAPVPDDATACVAA